MKDIAVLSFFFFMNEENGRNSKGNISLRKVLMRQKVKNYVVGHVCKTFREKQTCLSKSNYFKKVLAYKNNYKKISDNLGN